MSDQFHMGQSKLLWHMDRVSQRQAGEKIAPIHIDMGISRGCNIKCHYCFGKVQGNQYKNGLKQYVDRDSLINFVKDCGEVGVRSIAVIGEAEPLVNPYAYQAIIAAKESGVDVALATNAILWEDNSESELALKALTWLRINISSASYDSYRKIHGSKDFHEAIKKIKLIVKTKQKLGLELTIGLQMVLTPECLDQVVPLAKLGKELEVDYLVIKQCSDLQNNEIGIYDQLKRYNLNEFKEILLEAETYSSEGYSVIVKWEQIKNEGKRSYDSCLGAPFLLHTSGEGKIYSCASCFGGENKEKLLLGDYTKKRFKEILNTEDYWNVINKMQKIDVHKDCYSNCRTNSINNFLWSYKNPPKHLNFV